MPKGQAPITPNKPKVNFRGHQGNKPNSKPRCKSCGYSLCRCSK